MRILQLVTKRQYRGAEVFAANLSAELIKLGHEIIFVGLYKNDQDVLSVENAEHYDLIGSKDGRFSLGLIKKLVKLIKKTKPEIIQCNGSDTLKYMIAASIFIPKTPIVYRNISMISEWVSQGPKKLLYKQIFKKVDHVTSVGEEAIQDFIKTFNYPREKTTVIRRGIPIKEVDKALESQKIRAQLDLKKEDKITIHIGNFSPEKNHEFLLDIFEGLKSLNSSIKLVCVGNGVLFEHIKNEITKRKLERTVFLLGFRKDIPELLSASDCFVLSSKVEGVPGVILEAGTQYVPSVATNVGGVCEVIISGKTGYIIDDFDKEEFKQTLLKIILNEDLKTELGTNAYNLVAEEFNPLKNAQKFEALYRKLIPEKSFR
ncbi:glycosyltransferase family 4 protein [Gillisia limnaea]|uniref:Glycosyl transferase group 1 n=1 Tax=Gillisia limnaea (strain DSM 15749 / LMG 21470 / R-8282) TaxID=865937 RepID=H2BRT0_GILLR|nr:glycosyltransferase family 4 protein [Gillisia limnaea]EHQ01395.1 glycosyl transferase group 1 [Gillisia limnaea DSM 15749]